MPETTPSPILWRALAEVGSAFSDDWHAVRSPGVQYDPPPDPAVLGEAELVEDESFALHDFRAAESSGFEFFLDGTENTRVAGYAGLVPIVHGYVAAVVRQREQRSFHTWALAEEEVIAFPFARLDPQRLVSAGLPEDRLVDSGSHDDDSHPMRLAELGRFAIKRRRAALEASLARRWAKECEANRGWLLVDGGLAIEPRVLKTGRAVGLVKSHRTQYLDSSAMAEVLRMGKGRRSSVFRPIRPEIGEVYSWYLRLRPPGGHDIYWGLARIEARASAATVEAADELSRWLIHETAPLAMPDPRWHVLLYPIRDCENYLRSRMPTILI